MSTEPKPGTTEEGRAAEPTPQNSADGSTLAETERKELEELRAGKQQWLGERTKYEQTSKENQELAKQIDAMTSQPPTPGVDPVAQNVLAEYEALVWRARNGDGGAQLQLAVIEGQKTILKQTLLAALPEDERPQVQAVLQQNPQLDVSTARSIVQGQRATQRLRELETKEAEAKRQAEEVARSGAAGATSVRSVPGAALDENTIKASELRRRYDALNARVREGDRGARDEALKLSREVDTGKIKVILNE